MRCPQLVGRDAELGHLRAALDAVTTGAGAMVLVSGPAGVGKSRLAAELLDHAGQRGVPGAVGRSRPNDELAVCRPLGQALAQLVREYGLPDDESFAPWRAPLAAVLTPESAITHQSPASRGEAVLQLLHRVTRQHGTGVVLVLDDLHWADVDTLAVLEYVSDAVGTMPVLWLLTFRDEPAAPVHELAATLTARRGVTGLSLGRLAPDVVAQMVRACEPDADAVLVARVQRAAEGMPLFVEEIVAARGVPTSFARSVSEQLAAFDDPTVRVVGAAAVLGTAGSWDLLPAMTSMASFEVTERLHHVASQGSLLVAEHGHLRFRHALTREAVLATLAPDEHRRLAQAALDELDRAPERTADGAGDRADLVADLAEQAGDRRRAGLAVAAAGRRAAAEGGLATAIDTLRRARALLAGEPEAATTCLALVEVLARSGRVDEATDEGLALLRELDDTAELRGRVRLTLAEAAAGAARWTVAEDYLRDANAEQSSFAARTAMLAAEVDFARGRTDHARTLVQRVLDEGDADLRCRAQLLLGRMARLHDLGAARSSFEDALAVARAARDRIRELDALHELGTIEMFDHAGTRRLLEARELAEELGALGTRAVLDLQLAATYLGRFETSAAEHHAESARAVADRLGQHAVAAKALSELAETCVQRLDEAGMERYLALAAAQDPDDPFTPAFAWGQCRGLLAFYRGDWDAAVDLLARGMRELERIPQPEPVEYRAMWPLLLASRGDPRAQAALDDAAASRGLLIAFANRGLIAYAEAILAGRAGDRTRAEELSLRADAYLVRFPLWTDLARLCALESAVADGWGRPEQWCAEAAPRLTAAGYIELARRCTTLGSGARPRLTRRESEVLALVVEGLANKEIGARLHLSPRTVEKHVESLLRKTGNRSRTGLAVWAGSAGRVGETT